VLWNTAPVGDETRTLIIGYDRLAKLVGLNEKSVRDLMPKLAAKQVIEVVEAENSAARTGKTYRIYSTAEVLKRQRAQDLVNAVKNGRAIEFVWVLTDSQAATAIPSEVLSTTEGVSVTPSVSLVEKALATYGPADRAAAEALISAALRIRPDVSDSEIIHFVHRIGNTITSSGVHDKIAYLVVSLPGSLAGPEFETYRSSQRTLDAARRRHRAEILQQQDRQRAILADPEATATDKHWARLALGLDAVKS
jgi:hypothetical protein